MRIHSNVRLREASRFEISLGVLPIAGSDPHTIQVQCIVVIDLSLMSDDLVVMSMNAIYGLSIVHQLIIIV